MSKLKLSVIIPCYNQGSFLSEALSGVADQEGIEVIIVNDGSTDPETIEIFKTLDRSKYIVIEQENKGLGNTRNIAIEHANADYILALDADNAVFPEYYRKAIKILDENPEVGVVYSNPIFFGEKNENVQLIDFNLNKMLTANYIDACSIFRKKAWKQAGGYDANMPIQGYEDWDLWIGIAKNEWKFYYLNEHLFRYRVRGNSMLSDCEVPENKKKLIQYVRTKHKDLYEKNHFNIIDYLNKELNLHADHIVAQENKYSVLEEKNRALEEKSHSLEEKIHSLDNKIIMLTQELTLLHAKAESMRIKNRIKKLFN